jgi:hypothetical protein
MPPPGCLSPAPNVETRGLSGRGLFESSRNIGRLMLARVDVVLLRYGFRGMAEERRCRLDAEHLGDARCCGFSQVVWANPIESD